MPQPTVAILVKDPALRLRVAEAFDEAPQNWTVSFSDVPAPEADVVVVEDLGAGDGVVFDALQPDRLIPEIQARLRRSLKPSAGRAVAVTGVPGAGATSIAMHLALIWGRRSETCYLDLDTSWSSAPRLGLPEEAITWAGVKSAEAVRASSLPIAPGLRALVAPVGGTDLEDAKLVRWALKEFQRTVVDLPYARWLPQTADAMDVAVVVMSPCVAHAHRVARMLATISVERIAVVTNRLGRGGETTRAQLESIVGRKIAVELPTFPGLRDVEGRHSLASLTWCRWGRALQRLARAIEAS
jgi:hypothetical protein